MDAVDHISVSFHDPGSIDPDDVADNGSAQEAPLKPLQEDAVSVSDAETLNVPSQPDSVPCSSSSDAVPSPIPDLPLQDHLYLDLGQGVLYAVQRT